MTVGKKLLQILLNAPSKNVNSMNYVELEEISAHLLQTKNSLGPLQYEEPMSPSIQDNDTDSTHLLASSEQ
jgi:hypothetical protein